MGESISDAEFQVSLVSRHIKMRYLLLFLKTEEEKIYFRVFNRINLKKSETSVLINYEN